MKNIIINDGILRGNDYIITAESELDTITIIGNGNHVHAINAAHVSIIGDNNCLKNVTISNGGLKIKGKKNHILECFFTKNEMAIADEEMNETLIDNCFFTLNNEAINVTNINSNNNTINKCEFVANDFALSLYGNNNLITKNLFRNCHNLAIAVFGTRNIISGNRIIDSNQAVIVDGKDNRLEFNFSYNNVFPNIFGLGNIESANIKISKGEKNA